MMKADIEKHLKEAMLAGSKDEVTTLRTLKSVILDEEVKLGKRDEGLSDDEIVKLLQKEKKKRAESADLYKKAGDNERYDEETKEIKIIDAYLPEMMSEDEIRQITIDVLSQQDAVNIAQMGQIIGLVKGKTGNLADGSVIASIVKEEISKEAEG